ncbi:TerC family protein [Tepidibacillus fermentans]|uniref:YkoY family integral membrane protein n=1 Tax=Tepidibacillus fermentans TaxID=1281767 RepID=A0A4R3KAZ6_9BACI|nr:TerC family protein [Tepidibacillus fermentans]TCS80133.1 YkoY family integral membrane protein [Tepidibacillus fermentans]
MDYGILAEYGWTLLVLVGLEGLLAADNALVMAVMVKHLEPDLRKRALFYGLAGAFVFRFTSLFIISYLIDVWQVQALGAAYLIFLGLNHIFKRKENEETTKQNNQKKSGLWATVLKVELADIAFAVDSILAAVALAVSLPQTNLPNIGGMHGAHFIVVLAGGIIGLVLIRFAANWFVDLLHKRPGLETAAYLVVAWVGVKLAIHTLAHPRIHVLSHEFAESLLWKSIFWIILVFILGVGWFRSNHKE